MGTRGDGMRGEEGEERKEKEKERMELWRDGLEKDY